MKVNSVSFGKVVLVKAPLKEAYKIAGIANGSENTELAIQIKKIINDTKEGQAHAYSFNEHGDKSYIFSGEEGNDYWASYCEAWDCMNSAYAYYGNHDLADIESKDAWEKHAQNVNRIISTAKEPEIINVAKNRMGEISQINLEA